MQAHAQRECLEEKCEKMGTRRTVEVDVVELELLERLIELLLDPLGLVARVPQLRGHEDLLALRYARDHLLQRAPDLPSRRRRSVNIHFVRNRKEATLTHLVLVLVDHRAVDVPVPRADGDLDLCPPARASAMQFFVLRSCQ